MLRLSPAQEEQLLQLRKKHLRNLRNLYEDRQRLNLSVGSCWHPALLQLSSHQFVGGPLTMCASMASEMSPLTWQRTHWQA